MEGLKKPSCKIDVPHMLLMAAWPQKKENNKETPVYCGKITPPRTAVFLPLWNFPSCFFSSFVLFLILGEYKRISIVPRGWR